MGAQLLPGQPSLEPAPVPSFPDSEEALPLPSSGDLTPAEITPPHTEGVPWGSLPCLWLFLRPSPFFPSVSCLPALCFLTPRDSGGYPQHPSPALGPQGIRGRLLPAWGWSPSPPRQPCSPTPWVSRRDASGCKRPFFNSGPQCRTLGEICPTAVVWWTVTASDVCGRGGLATHACPEPSPEWGTGLSSQTPCTWTCS